MFNKPLATNAALGESFIGLHFNKSESANVVT
jgi:hypothetical protein